MWLLGTAGGGVSLSCHLDDFPRANARCTRFDGFGRAVHEGVHTAQVGIPATLGHIVRVTDVIAIDGTISAKVTDTSHCYTPFQIGR